MYELFSQLIEGEAITSRRRYNLGKRRASVEETRRRILDGAVAAYRDHGVVATSMQEVARRADVAPGTVLNHFKTPDDLVAAVIDRLLAHLGVPGSEVLEGLTGVEERVRRVVEELLRFFERSAQWLAFFQRDLRQVPVLDRAEAENYRQRAGLIREAVAPTNPSPQALAAVVALTQPEMIGALMRAGEDYADVPAAMTRLVMGALGGRSGAEEVEA